MKNVFYMRIIISNLKEDKAFFNNLNFFQNLEFYYVIIKHCKLLFYNILKVIL